LKDSFNLRKCVEVLRYFNTGGELAFLDEIKPEDLTHRSSHEDKVQAIDIQDLHI
jgi:hypothetical protein